MTPKKSSRIIGVKVVARKWCIIADTEVTRSSKSLLPRRSLFWVKLDIKVRESKQLRGM